MSIHVNGQSGSRHNLPLFGLEYRLFLVSSQSTTPMWPFAAALCIAVKPKSASPPLIST